MSLPMISAGKQLSDADMQRIVTAYGAQMKRLCRLYLGDAHLAEDAAQEALIKIYRHSAAFRGECAEKTWITCITANVCRDMLRTGWMRRHDRSRTPEMLPLQAEPPSDGFAVKDMVMSLPPGMREVVLLRYYQDMTLSDIAAALRITPYRVRQRLAAAHVLLRQKLKGWYFDETASECSTAR